MSASAYNPWNDSRSGDGEQLPLGAFEDAPLLPHVGAVSQEEAEPEAPAAFRELPVCGEWSYEVHDDAESRGAALVADAISATAAAQRTAAVAARTASADPARAATAEVLSPPDSAHAETAGAAQKSLLGAAGLSSLAPLRRSTDTPRPPRAVMTPRIGTRVPATPTPLPALDELRSQHEAHPGDAKTAIALSAAFDKRGNIAAALGALQRAIDAGADAVPLRCARAAILSGRLRYDDAEAELKKAAKVNADDPEVLLQLGILACRRAKWRDAIEPLTRLIKLDAASAQGLFHLGETLNKLDKLPDALVAYERASELEPDNWRALKGVGIVLDRMGRPTEAAAFYRRARDAQRG